MPKPRKSTFDAHVDQFADFDLDTQERVIEMCEFVYRQARRRAGRGRKDEEAVEQRVDAAKPQPAAHTATAEQPSLTGLPDEDQR